MNVSGYCDPKFSVVQEQLEKNLTERGDVGASIAISLEGEMVVDLWGGYKDEERTQPWEEDTIVNVYSTSKTMTFLVSMILIERGLINLDTPVAHYWPEFGQNGKEGVLFRHLMSHSAGVPGFDPYITKEELFDWNTVTANLAAQAPWWEPGTASGYHAVSQGFLIGEVVRRVTGKTIGTVLREEVAEIVGADFHIGLAPEHFSRVSNLITRPGESGLGSLTQLGPESITMRTFGSVEGGGGGYSHLPEWRQAELPAVNGHGNARSVVRAQTVMANDGVAFGKRLLQPETVRMVLEEQTNGPDKVLIMPLRFGLGYGLTSDLMPLKGNIAWWAGAGGSFVVNDMDNRMCFSYVMNQMGATLLGDERATGPLNAAYTAF